MRTSARSLLMLSLLGAGCLLPPPLESAPLARFASFFNVVKQRVNEQWNPAEAYRRIDPTGTLLGAHINRYTSSYTELGIELTPDGGLRRLEVLEPSGLQFL